MTDIKEQIAFHKKAIKDLQKRCIHFNRKVTHMADPIITWDMAPDRFATMRVRIKNKCLDCGKQWTQK